MPMKFYLYDNNSESGRALVEACEGQRLRHEGSTFTGSPEKTVINWGCSNLPVAVRRCKVINNEVAVYMAINKDHCLYRLHSAGVPAVEWTRSADTALGWYNDGCLVYCRGRLAGHDGEGLVVADPASGIQRTEMPPARIYTKGVPIQQEYRVTVFSADAATNATVIAAQRKVKHDDAERTTSDIVRVSSTGWGFKLVNHERYLPAPVRDAATAALLAMGLNFAGVDVVLLPDGTARVLELNTAPALTPTVCHRLAGHLIQSFGNDPN